MAHVAYQFLSCGTSYEIMCEDKDDFICIYVALLKNVKLLKNIPM